MDQYIDIKVRVWRQAGPKAQGHFETYELKHVFQGASFLEMIDILNEQLISEHKDPITFDHDCREGICGMCSMYVNGHPHGPDSAITTCQLHMRKFKDGETITVEPWRSRAFPVIKDLMVDRQAYDKLELGAFVDGECRGSSVLVYFEPTDRWYAMLTVAGEEGEEINFAVINRRKANTSAGTCLPQYPLPKCAERRIARIRS